MLTLCTRALISTGLTLVTLGQILRSTAMITAASNFSHLIQYSKAAEHTLVRTGIYAWSRHPSYFAFFYWALGTQIFVGNPVAFLAFFFILYRFFSGRIQGTSISEYVMLRPRIADSVRMICVFGKQSKNGTSSSSSVRIMSSTRKKCHLAFRLYLSNLTTRVSLVHAQQYERILYSRLLRSKMPVHYQHGRRAQSMIEGSL